MNNSEILIYRNPGGKIRIDVRLENETVWLTQAHMAELFQVKPQNITMHLKNIYADGELREAATCKEFLQVQTDGSRLEKSTLEYDKYRVTQRQIEHEENLKELEQDLKQLKPQQTK